MTRRLLPLVLAVLAIGVGAWRLSVRGGPSPDEEGGSSKAPAVAAPQEAVLKVAPLGASARTRAKKYEFKSPDELQGEPQKKRIVVHGRVEPARGPNDEPTAFTISGRFDSGESTGVSASGSIGPEGKLEASLDVDSRIELVDVLVTRSGTGFVGKEVEIPDSGTVDVVLTLPIAQLVHGVAVDEAGKAVVGMCMTWGVPWTPLSPWLDPRRSPEGWYREGCPPWAVTDATGRFAFAGVSADSDGEPRSTDPGTTSTKIGGTGAPEDPILVRVQAVPGVLLRVIDSESESPIREFQGAFVVRVDERIVFHGHLSGRAGWYWLGSLEPSKPSETLRASCLIESDGYASQRVEATRRAGEAPSPITVRLARESAATEARFVRIIDPAILQLVRGKFWVVERVVSFGDLDIPLTSADTVEDSESVGFNLAPGSHRVVVHLDGGLESLVVWTLVVTVPMSGEAEVVAHPPRTGSLRLVDPRLRTAGEERDWHIEVLSEPGRSNVLGLTRLTLTSEGRTIARFPVGDWVLVELEMRQEDSTIRAVIGREWPFHVDPDRETVVELK